MPRRDSKWLLNNFIIHVVQIFILKSGYENLAVLLMKIQVFWDVVTLVNGYKMTYDVSFQTN
jgi:hypothetical protein